MERPGHLSLIKELAGFFTSPCDTENLKEEDVRNGERSSDFVRPETQSKKNMEGEELKDDLTVIILSEGDSFISEGSKDKELVSFVQGTETVEREEETKERH